MMDLNEFFQGVRLLAHLLTMLIVAGYCPDSNTNKRPGVSLFAIVIAGGSAGLAMSTALSWCAWLVMPTAGHVFLALIFVALLVPIIAGRGNVASLFPRKVWSDRP